MRAKESKEVRYGAIILGGVLLVVAILRAIGT